MQKILNFIGGEFVPPTNGRFLENIDPSRGKTYSLVPDSDRQDVERAVNAAARAFPAWSQRPVAERSGILNKIADLILRDIELLALAESRDNGKPISLARTADIPRSAANFRFFAAAITQFHGESFLSDQAALNYTESAPLGVVACISPWNLPLLLLTWKLAPALAAGNTVVAKPSEITPMTAYLLCKIASEAGLPPGVLNIVHGSGPNVGEPLVTAPLIKAVSFTGSTATGRRIAESSAAQFKKVSLEMGGKNANIIFADADFEKSLEMTLRSSFANQGQICLCGSRIFVEKSIYEKFCNELVARTKKLKSGDPLKDDTQQGALVSKTHWEKVKHGLQKAKEEGGRILCGGGIPQLEGDLASGYYLEPTLIEGLDHLSSTNQEEIFGPVATLIPFTNEEEVIAMANATRYGLSASLWTQNLNRAHRVARKLESGMVWVNTWNFRDLRTPFGGVKESGVGREGGMEALKFFTETKNICIALQSAESP
jgi:aminomuconate-semialdehyde/2-hydroxymuconate-6-semialdehyde dehydrogenase